MNQISAIDIMRQRQSIRTYEAKRITPSDLKQINEYIKTEENLVGPFGEKGRVEFVQVRNNVTDKGIRLGTYGFIKNPQAYLVGICENNKKSLLEYAYTFHKMILYLCGMGLGTCWMGGTFSRTSFERELSLSKEEFIPCVTPIGYPKDRQRVFDVALRIVVKADNKKAWDKLFYLDSFEKTLTKDKARELAIPIEMVRLGPSASNKQPWRLVLSSDHKVCHFYLEHTPNYSSSLGYDMQVLDIGIAMCQFESACKELGITGEWVIDDPNLALPNQLTEYMVTWKARS